MKKVILLSGKLQAGKNTIATYLAESLEKRGLTTTEDLFAKALKDGAKEDFKPLTDYLNRKHEQFQSKLPDGLKQIKNDLRFLKSTDENFYEDKTDLTRILLQVYGTNIFRNRVDSDHWVNQLIERVRNSSEDVILVTDVRFPNEVDLMVDCPDFEVTSVRIEREIERDPKTMNHPSETSLDDYELWTYIIDNNGSFDQLNDSAKLIVSELLDGENREETRAEFLENEITLRKLAGY